MDLKVIASISGKSGLFKVIKPTRTGLIVESIDEKKLRTAIGANSRVSVLKEVSMYTTDGDGSTPLANVLLSIFEKYGGKELPYNNKSSAEELSKFLLEVLPNADTTKIYQSDLKKLVSWYNILIKFSPQTFELLKNPEENSEKREKENIQENNT
ncbi:MAG: DUF5606 domain-containing protein [Microscillaceae bacterium]|nr:DUF5606 domain-containing protein [Microscillaceae bacterium]MDW8460380.1 DUF5606 domain-containing protein [Cytophagales bacterium]